MAIKRELFALLDDIEDYLGHRADCLPLLTELQRCMAEAKGKELPTTKVIAYEPQATRTEPALRLRLTSISGGVMLSVVDVDGGHRPSGDILSIADNGTLYLFGCVDRYFGLALDGDGRIQIAK